MGGKGVFQHNCSSFKFSNRAENSYIFYPPLPPQTHTHTHTHTDTQRHTTPNADQEQITTSFERGSKDYIDTKCVLV